MDGEMIVLDLGWGRRNFLLKLSVDSATWKIFWTRTVSFMRFGLIESFCLGVVPNLTQFNYELIETWQNLEF